MAQSPAHSWGQIVGDVIEGAVRARLSEVADQYGLYLDFQGDRPARPGKKVTWHDDLGNSHDLDYVIERGGATDALGEPVAFVEVAWRRYTKHSRNKAQEIQGAVLPVAERFRHVKPFLGAVVAGEFTEGALRQLQSVGFAVLHLPYRDIVEAFDAVGIDAGYEEGTPDSMMRAKLAAWRALDSDAAAVVGQALFERSDEDVKAFHRKLEESLGRRAVSIRVLPLYGEPRSFAYLKDAIEFVTTVPGSEESSSFVRVEVVVEFSNGDRIEGQFGDGGHAESFLRNVVG